MGWVIRPGRGGRSERREGSRGLLEERFKRHVVMEVIEQCRRVTKG